MFKTLLAIYRIIDARTRIRLPFALLIMLLLSGLEVLGISLIFPLIQTIVGGTLPQSAYFKAAFTWIKVNSDPHVGLMIASFIFGLFILKNLFSIFLVKWQIKFLAEADLNLSKQVMKQYMSMPYLFYLSGNSVNIASHVMYIVTAACSGFLGGILMIMTDLTMIIVVIALLILFSPLTMLSVGLFVAVVAWAFQFYSKGKTLKIGQLYLDLTNQAWKNVVQTFLAIKDLRVLDREESIYKNFCELRNQLCKVEVAQKFTQFLPRYFLEIVFSVAALLCCVFIFKIQKGDTSTHLALLGVIGVSFIRLMPSVNRMLSTLQLVRINMPAVETLKNAKCMHEEKQTKSVTKITPVAGKGHGLVLNQVSFIYPNRDKPAIKNIDLSIQWGESIGLVGASGSGKSTLIEVILGLLIPNSGAVFLDGKELSTELSSWRKRIGYVPQSIYLWDDTLLANISLGIPKNEINKAALARAIKLSNLESLLEQLPQGLETMVGERGVQLSGGQRQCIGIARALYRDPAILILDEATSSLDNESEYRISNMLEEFYGKKTFIIVAHRLSTVRRCDRIAFMEKGRIIDSGDFNDLQRRNEAFRSLVALGTL